MMWTSRSSALPDTAAALRELLAGLDLELGGPPDLLLPFVSPEHLAQEALISSELQRAAPAARVLGCTAAGVAGGGAELEAGPCLALTAARLPDVESQVLRFGPGGDLPLSATPDQLGAQLHVSAEQQPVVLVLCDPYSVDAQALVALLDQALPGCVKVGGLASGGTRPGGHALWAGGELQHEGAVCLLLWGDLEAQPIVAQGARPLGPPMRITRGDRSYVLELDGRPALSAFQALVSSLDDDERGRLRRGAVVGLSTPSDEDRRPGPNDLLVRNLVGMDPEHGVIGIGGPARTGSWLRFMVRDAQAARDELTELLADAAPAQAALLVSCMGRGEAFFRERGHDTRLLQERLGPVPVGGFFANGELGPLRGRTWLHAYTSSVALLRQRAWD